MMGEDALDHDAASRRRDVSELEAIEAELAGRKTQNLVDRLVTWIGVPAAAAVAGLEISGHLSSDIGFTLLVGVVTVPVVGWWTGRKRPIETIRAERARLLERLEAGRNAGRPERSDPWHPDPSLHSEAHSTARASTAPAKGSLDPRVEQALRELEVEVEAAEMRVQATRTTALPLTFLAGTLLLLATIFTLVGILSPNLDLLGAVLPLPVTAGGIWAFARYSRRRHAEKLTELEERRAFLRDKLAENPTFRPLSSSARKAMAGELNADRYRSMLDFSWLNRTGFSLILGAGAITFLADAPWAVPVMLLGMLLMGIGFLRWEREHRDGPTIDRTLLADGEGGATRDAGDRGRDDGSGRDRPGVPPPGVGTDS